MTRNALHRVKYSPHTRTVLPPAACHLDEEINDVSLGFMSVTVIILLSLASSSSFCMFHWCSPHWRTYSSV